MENAVRRLGKQVAISEPFSCYEGQGLEELLGEQRDLFDHFLNFHAMERKETHFGGGATEPPYERVWDAQGLPLGLYFQPGEGRLAITILYNQYSLKEGAVAELVERYFLTLQTMLVHMDMPIRALKDAIRKRMKAFLAKDETELTAERLALSLGELPLFKGISEERLQRLSKTAKQHTYFESDQIIMGHDSGQLYFLLEGRVARYMDPGNGWFSLLDAAKEGRFLNETVFITECRSRIMSEVMSEQAKVLTLPLPQVVDLVNIDEEFRIRLFGHLLREMEKYQRRWVSN